MTTYHDFVDNCSAIVRYINTANKIALDACLTMDIDNGCLLVTSDVGLIWINSKRNTVEGRFQVPGLRPETHTDHRVSLPYNDTNQVVTSFLE